MTPHPDQRPKPTPVEVQTHDWPAPNQFRILIADDQAANRLILSRLLNITGYLTFEACDGQQALDLVVQGNTDLVIMDVEMPNLNGLEAIRKIRALADPRIASLPILAATGNPLADTQRELLDTGANDFLTKPFDTQILLKTIARLLSPSPGPKPELTTRRPKASKSLKNLG